MERRLRLVTAVTGLLALLAAVTVAVAHATPTRTADTKTQAYNKARHCLLASGKVSRVGRRRDGGGYVFFRGDFGLRRRGGGSRVHRYFYWTYHLDNSKQVARVWVHAGKLPARELRLLRRCTSVVS